MASSDNKQSQNSNKEESKNIYRDTVFLPTTSFPMRGGLPKLEPTLLEQWGKHGVDSEIKSMDEKKTQVFTLHDGPPYANGHIHIGHALNKISKDIINRAQRMNGAQVRYLPGWDCHGLPIEWKVEEKYRKKGLDKDSVPVLDFRKECRDYAKEWVGIQMSGFKRLGIQAEWDNRYVTMDFSSEAIIAEEIGKFVLNKRLYKGLRPVLWSVVEKTALAEAEVEYKDVKSEAIFVAFPVLKDPTNGKLKGASALIWTTTPWTLPLNRALAYGPDIDYGVYEVEAVEEGSRSKVGQRFILSESLSEKVLTKLGVSRSKKVSSFKGEELAGAECKHPFAYLTDCESYTGVREIFPGDFVTEEAGTGLVHMAPGHGEDDFRLCKNNGVQLHVEVDESGLYAKHLDFVAGQHIFKAPEVILEKLDETREKAWSAKEAAGLMSRETMVHSYPHSWRSGAPLIYRATSQWFISMDQESNGYALRKAAMDALKDVDFVPARSRRRLESMVEGRPDWCISRQRSWGVPLPLFTHVETGELLRDADVLKAVVEAFKAESADCWYKEGSKERFLKASKQQLDPKMYEQAFDVVDVWFESGCSHRFVEQNGLKFPANLYLEGSDQHRGWFQSSLLERVGTNGHAPYKALLTQGFVLDGQGRKMSKSLGNVIAPSEVVDQMGADLLRLWVAQSDSSDDLRVSKEILRQQSEAYRRIRNTLRWVLGGLDNFKKEEELPYEALPDLEKYVLHQLALLWDKFDHALKTHDWNGVYPAVYNFCNQELSAFYFDLRKDTLYCDAPNSQERRAVRTVLDKLFTALTTWLAPVLVFTAEEAWQSRYAPEGGWASSVHLEGLVKPESSWHNPKIAQQYDELREIRKSVTRVLEEGRTSGLFRSSLEAEVHMPLNEKERSLMDEKGWEFFALVSKAQFIDEKGEFKAVVAQGEKCPRCWRITEDHASEDHLCARCASVVK